VNDLLVVFERYLDREGVSLRIAGFVARDVAHAQGIPHGTVQVGVVVPVDMGGEPVPHLLLSWRSRWKETGPQTWDICGGHIDADAEFMGATQSWEDQDTVRAMFDRAAIREANEEVRLKGEESRALFSSANVMCFGGLGFFETGFDDRGAKNREHSAFYLAFLPCEEPFIQGPDAVQSVFLVRDSIRIAGREREEASSRLKLATLPELALDFSRRPSCYADGIGRILKVMHDQPRTMRALDAFIASHYPRAAGPPGSHASGGGGRHGLKL
jgi:8-oxo-dGTP pyrophosphatase MutT (NUDIX family)